MGENSKKIGEHGESYVEKILNAVGWSDLKKGIELKCSNESHVNKKGNPLRTHGIDFQYSYISPLVDGQLNNVIVSVKNQDYPNNPSQKFREFMKELAAMIECYDCSEQKQNVTSNFHCNSINDIGVLFWIEKDENSSSDLIKSVSSVRLDEIKNNVIYVVDSRRAKFILEVMRFIKTKNDCSYSFYYPLTGRNINPQNRNNIGKILPVEYLNSSIIPIKLEKKDNNKEISLLLATIDNFEAGDFMRLMGLAKDISTNLVGEVIIAFPNYDQLKHSNVVNELKQGFQDADFTKTVSVINYIHPINSL